MKASSEPLRKIPHLSMDFAMAAVRAGSRGRRDRSLILASSDNIDDENGTQVAVDRYYPDSGTPFKPISSREAVAGTRAACICAVTVLEFDASESFLPHFRSCRAARSRTGRPRPRLHRQGGVRHSDDTRPGECRRRQAIAPVGGWRRCKGSRAKRPAPRAFAVFGERVPARLHEALIEQTLGAAGRACLARRDGDRGSDQRPAAKLSAERPQVCERLPPAQGRGAAQGAAPRGAPAQDDAAADAR